MKFLLLLLGFILVVPSTFCAQKHYAEIITLTQSEEKMYNDLFAYTPRFPKVCGTPKDSPINPHVFVANAGSGAWMLGVPVGSRKASRQFFVPEIPKVLVANGAPGGRIHVGVSGLINKETQEVRDDSMKSIISFIDACLDQGMYVLLMYDSCSARNPNKEDLQLLFKVWDDICYKMRNKSYRLSMAPFIEWHGWEKSSKDERVSKFKCLQKRCEEIFRRYNPNRIYAYKGIGSSRVNSTPWRFLNLGCDDINPYFILSGSAASLGTTRHSCLWYDWNINKEHTNQEIKDEIFNFFLPALKFREKYNVAIYIDHWTAPVEGNEESSIDVDKRIAELKNSRTRRAKINLQILLRKIDRAKRKHQVFVLKKFKLSQSKAFIDYVSKLIKNNGIGGAFFPHTFDYFWDRKNQKPAIFPKDSPQYNAQEIIKKSWGKSKLWKPGTPIWH